MDHDYELPAVNLDRAVAALKSPRFLLEEAEATIARQERMIAELQQRLLDQGAILDDYIEADHGAERI